MHAMLPSSEFVSPGIYVNILSTETGGMEPPTENGSFSNF